MSAATMTAPTIANSFLSSRFVTIGTTSSAGPRAAGAARANRATRESRRRRAPRIPADRRRRSSARSCARSRRDSRVARSARTASAARGPADEVVPIVTNRDERKLFAIVGAVIVAALIALLQLDFARAGRTSPLTATVTTASTYLQYAASALVNGVRGTFDLVVRTPGLASENGRLRGENGRLLTQNDELQERLARVPAAQDLAAAKLAHPDGVTATVIGYDPEAATHVVTIDRGAKDHVQRDDGVVGRIVEVSPLSSKVLLVTDATSKLPAVVQHGRWWAIAVGTSTRVKLQYVSQDAKLKDGDRVVTGEGRSFRAGILIGRIKEIEPAAAGALDQTAIVQPAADLTALSRVLVLPQKI